MLSETAMRRSMADAMEEAMRDSSMTLAAPSIVTGEHAYRIQVSDNWCARLEIGHDPTDDDLARHEETSCQVVDNRVDGALLVAEYTNALVSGNLAESFSDWIDSTATGPVDYGNLQHGDGS